VGKNEAASLSEYFGVVVVAAIPQVIYRQIT